MSRPGRSAAGLDILGRVVVSLRSSHRANPLRADTDSDGSRPSARGREQTTAANVPPILPPGSTSGGPAATTTTPNAGTDTSSPAATRVSARAAKARQGPAESRQRRHAGTRPCLAVGHPPARQFRACGGCVPVLSPLPHLTGLITRIYHIDIYF